MRSSIKFHRPASRKQRAYTQARDYYQEKATSRMNMPSPASEGELKTKLRLVPLKQKQSRKISPRIERDRMHVQRKNNQLLREDVYELKKGISLIREELQFIRKRDQQLGSVDLIKPSIFFREQHQANKNKSRIFYRMSPKNKQRVDTQPTLTPKNQHKLQSQRLRLRTLNDEDQQHSLVLPNIEKIIYSPYRRRQKKQYFEGSYKQYNSLIKRPRLKKKFIGHFRKAAHAILFTIYLRTFNQRMRKQRKALFDTNIKQKLNQKLLQLKKYLIEGSKLFFSAVIDQYKFDYLPTPDDDNKLRRQKIKALKKLTAIQVDCLHNCIRQMSKREYLSQMLYFLCKHGTFSCLYPINSKQQMNLMCISEVHSYMRGDKCLEQSSILSLVFIKILLYNVLLKPQSIDLKINQKVDKAVIYRNIKIVANLLYEIFVQIQDDLLEQSPQIYTIGNWEKLKHRFNLQVAQSMTVKPGYYQNNELISGFNDHKVIRQLYGIKTMVQQKGILLTSLKYLHQNIINHHEKIRKKCFLK